MLFGNCNGKANVHIVIDIMSIEGLKKIKFLGVMIDSKISWK